jgi:hypothetical protein
MRSITTECAARSFSASETGGASSEWCETVATVMDEGVLRHPATLRLWDGAAERPKALDEWLSACEALYVVLDTSVREEPRTWMEKRAMASKVDGLFGRVKRACLRMPQ